MGKGDLSRVNYRFRVIAANSQFPMANWRYRGSDRTYTPSPLTFLYTIFDNPASPAPANAYATRRWKRYGICRWRFVDYASIENTKFGSRLPAFSPVCFSNKFHRQHSLNVSFRPTQPTAQSTPTLGVSNRPIISSSLSEILKTKSMRSYFSYLIYSTDLTSTPIDQSPRLSFTSDCLLTRLSVYALALLV